MTEHDSKQLESRDKMKTPAQAAEQTRPGPTFSPAVDILETEGELLVLADMPGVQADDLRVDLHENVLTMTGTATPPEGEAEVGVHREFDYGTFVRQFSLAETIDQGRIEATLADGVLRLRLPKIEAAKPRRIQVQAS